MWGYIIITFVMAFAAAFLVAKLVIKPKVITETKTIRVEVPTLPDDYNDYLEWKQNKNNVTEIVSDELYTKLETIVKEALDKKFPEVEKEDTSIETPEIKTIKAKVKRKKS